MAGVLQGLVLAAWLLAGCSAPPNAAEQADAAACTAQADAIYRAQNYDQLSRTSQTGLYFAPTPNHVFDAQQQGAMHERDSQITSCESRGNGTSNPAYGAPLVMPHIISP